MNTEVLEIISDVIQVPVAQLTPEMSVGDVPTWNSMAQMTLIAALEERLGLEFPVEDLFELISVQGILDEVAKMKGV